MRASFLLLSLALVACQSTSPAIVEADASIRDAMFSPVKALEGRWTGTSADGTPVTHEFKVSSAGSIVREIMFPGEEHEMTNVYALDGNTLMLTHYCAGGQQPRMRATSIDGDEIAFRFQDITDLKPTDEGYMGEMTLKLVDANHIEQHWTSFFGGEPMEMVFELTRTE